MKKETKQKLLQNAGWLGIAGVIFYFLHVIIGGIIYEGYNPVKQAISDLTAKGADSIVVARIFSALYGVFTLAFKIAFYIFFRKKINRIFELAVIFFIVMNIVSTIGFTAFPLSEPGFAKTFQDTMHVVVTVIVVAFSIASLTLFAVGFIRHGKYKSMGFMAIGTLILMMLGSIMLGAAPSILGIGERINIYALQLYMGALAVFLLRFREDKNS